MDDRTTAAPGARLLGMWRRCRALPLGTRLFDTLLGRQVPYSGALCARVLELAPGHARLALADRRQVRNHLRSIHAIALANLGELTSGLAMATALPPGVRSIVVAIEVEYLKKARGTIVADSDVTLPALSGELEHVARARLRDAAGDEVARVAVRWRLGLA